MNKALGVSLAISIGLMGFQPAIGTVEGQTPDLDAFPCLRLAYEAGRAGETAPAWLSAANEVAVDEFLKGRIGWVDISDVVEATLQEWPGTIASGVDVVLDIDRQARARAAELIEQRVHV